VENRGIALNTGSNDCVVAGNTVTWNRFQGIVVSDSTRVLVDGNTVGDNADHGIYLINSAANVVRGNESYRNARPAVRAANGLALNGSTGNLLENNRLHHNQDTGMQIGAGSHDNLSRQNISWSNGDHGYDHLGSVSNQHIGDVAWGNFKDGFSQEGNAPGNLLYNCIGVDNGLTTAEFNLWVDSTSTAGFRSDHNIFWNSNGQSPVKYGATVYATLADFSAATGHDARSIQSDPRFTDPVSGLFGLLVGSPAIDSATSMAPNWPSLDAQGSPRGDEIHTPDTGIGPVAYADRGAIEFDPNDYPGFPPSASLTAQPATGSSPLLVTLDASGSSDPDGPLASWTFDFGDGSPLLSQASATAQHTYAAGSYTATVTVTDGDGLTDLASANISVNSSPTAGLTVAPSSGRAPLVVLADASGSTDIDGTIVSYTFDFGDGVIVGPQPGATASHTYAAGNWTARVTVTDDDGGQGTRTAGVIVAANQPPNGVIDAPAANLVIQIGQSVSFQGTGSDPEGDTPLTYRWQFGNAAPASTLEDPGPVTFTKQGNYKVTFTVTDSRGLADPTPASVTIFVRK
jgi:parallel beta-helix repeat protein